MMKRPTGKLASWLAGQIRKSLSGQFASLPVGQQALHP